MLCTLFNLLKKIYAVGTIVFLILQRRNYISSGLIISWGTKREKELNIGSLTAAHAPNHFIVLPPCVGRKRPGTLLCVQPMELLSWGQGKNRWGWEALLKLHKHWLRWQNLWECFRCSPVFLCCTPSRTSQIMIMLSSLNTVYIEYKQGPGEIHKWITLTLGLEVWFYSLGFREQLKGFEETSKRVNPGFVGRALTVVEDALERHKSLHAERPGGKLIR